MLEARAVLRKYRPRVVAITGSVGKTGAKDAVYSVLRHRFRARCSEKSFNSEIGVPLTILDLPNGWYNPIIWAKNILDGLSQVLFRSNYPELLVLEVGADRPGDIKKLAKWLPVDVAVVTRLPEVPVHVEFFSSPEQVVEEKMALAKSVKSGGAVVLNHDDSQIMRWVPNLRGRICSFGFNLGATLRASSEHLLMEKTTPIGWTFKVDYEGNNVPFRVLGLLGRHQLYGVLVAIAVGLSQGMNLVEIAEALKTLETPPGRLKPLLGIKNTLILDDTYNSSPAAVAEALSMLDLVAGSRRKIAVLGDMMELGQYTVEAHRLAGKQAGRVADFIVTVGPRSKFTADEAGKMKWGRGVVKQFNEAREAGRWLQNFIEPGDVILVKGSQSIRLERVVEEIMAEPEKKNKLLVRQEPEWLNR